MKLYFCYDVLFIYYYTVGDFLDMHEVTNLSKDMPIQETVVQEFREHFRSRMNIGKIFASFLISNFI